MDKSGEFWAYLNTHAANEIDRTTIVQFWGRANEEANARAEAAEAERDETRRQLEQARKAITVKIDEIRADERLSYETASVLVNAPLALVQVSLEAKIVGLSYALEQIEAKS